MDKKLNNLLGYKDYSLENMTKQAKTTKRTEVAKDVINEHHKSDKKGQVSYIKSKLSEVDAKTIEKIYKMVEDCCESTNE